MKTDFIFPASNSEALEVPSNGPARHLTFITDTIKAPAFKQKEALLEKSGELTARINSLPGTTIEQFYANYAIRVLINAPLGIVVAIKGKAQSEGSMKRKYLLQ